MALPPGRLIDIPGRGQTFIREVQGPDNAPTLILLHGWTATADLNWFTCFEELGKHFYLADQYIKLHAACRHIHPAADGVLAVMKDKHLAFADIESVDVFKILMI